MKNYVQDSVCETWELLADAVHTGGSSAIKKAGWPLPGQVKHEWAKKIAPLMDNLYHRNSFIINVVRHNDTRPNLACFGTLGRIKIDINDEAALQVSHSGHPVIAVLVTSCNSAFCS